MVIYFNDKIGKSIIKEIDVNIPLNCCVHRFYSCFLKQICFLENTVYECSVQICALKYFSYQAFVGEC